MVTDTKMSKIGAHYIVVSLFANSIAPGDKIATVHGLKSTVEEILDDDKMPLIMDEISGKTFRPNLLLSTKSMGLGMGGQIAEVAAGMNMFESVGSYRTAIKPSRKSTFTIEDQKEVTPRLPNRPLIAKRKAVVRDGRERD